MEGVLIPELWPHVAVWSGISALCATTREIPDYPQLVAQRIALLKRHNLRLQDIHVALSNVEPFSGATDFLAALNSQWRVVLVSDAFAQMIRPLWGCLGKPELRCHRFQCGQDGVIQTAHFSRREGKHEVIQEFANLESRTLAVGDAFNDLSMLRLADLGILFRPSAATLDAATDLPVADSYADILRMAHDTICLPSPKPLGTTTDAV